MPLQMLLLRYSHHLFELNCKLPSNGKRHRVFQPVYNLRKF